MYNESVMKKQKKKRMIKTMYKVTETIFSINENGEVEDKGSEKSLGIFENEQEAKKELVKAANKEYLENVNLYDPQGDPDHEYLQDDEMYASLYSESFKIEFEVKKTA